MLFFIIVDLDLDLDDDDGSLLLVSLNLVHSPFPRLKSSRDARDELSAADADADAIVGINKAADAAMRASRRLRMNGNDDDDGNEVDTVGCLSSAFISSFLLLLSSLSSI